jgi:hypothetical protein
MFEGVAESGVARETELAESEGKTVWFAALRAFHAGCRVAGLGEVGEIRGVAGIEGPLFLTLELTLAGGAARLRLVLVVRDFATLAPSSWLPSSDPATGPHSRPTELTIDNVSVPSAFERIPSIDRSSWSSCRVAIEPVAGRAVRSAYAKMVIQYLDCASCCCQIRCCCCCRYRSCCWMNCYGGAPGATATRPCLRPQPRRFSPCSAGLLFSLYHVEPFPVPIPTALCSSARRARIAHVLGRFRGCRATHAANTSIRHSS